MNTIICRSLALLVTTTVAAKAATIKVEPASGERPIPLIIVIGDIEPTDGEAFVEKTTGLSQAVVAFHSGGGSLLSGIIMGTEIRQKRFKTLVTRSSTCASACAAAWLGGSERYMQPGARIGFHAAYDSTGREKGSANAVLGAYLSKIGLSYPAIAYITSAPPSGMNWLTPAAAVRYRIAIAGLPQSALSDTQREATPRPPPAQRPPSIPRPPVWTYNGSTFSLSADGTQRKFYYSLPRAGLTEVGVRSGTLFFEGQQIGRTYHGRAYVFSKVCGPIGYAVRGEVSEGDRSITLSGQAPSVDDRCRVAASQAVTFEIVRNEERTVEAPATPPPANVPQADDEPFVPPWEVPRRRKRLW